MPTCFIDTHHFENRNKGNSGGTREELDSCCFISKHDATFILSNILIFLSLGLRADDLHMEENPDVEQAIKRLTEEDQMLRIFRIKRAMDLTVKHNILPKEEWTKPEEVCFSIHVFAF